MQLNILIGQAKKRVAGVALIFVWALALALAAPVAQAQLLFTPPQKLTSNTSSSVFVGEQLIAVDALGNINMIWLDSTNGANVMFSRSTDGGITFSAPVSLSSNLAVSIFPSLALDASGNIYVAWGGSANPVNQPSSIFFTRSTDGGSTFSTPVNVSGSLLAAGQSMVLDSSGNVYLVWSGAFDNTTLTYGPVFFSMSSDGGATFSTPVQVSNDQTQDAQVAVDAGGNINVCWYESVNGGGFHSPVYFSRSSDGGATFSTPINVYGDTFYVPQQQMAVDSSGNIYIVANLHATQDGAGDIWLASSGDGGATFSMTNLSNNTGIESSGQGEIALDSAGNINVAWVEQGPFQVVYRRSTDGGSTFSDPVNVAGSTQGSIGNSQVAVDTSGNINVVWDQNTNPYFSILYSRSSDGGSTFSTPQNISNNPGNSEQPVMAVDSLSNAYVVWQDDSPHQGMQHVWNIFFSRSISLP